MKTLHRKLAGSVAACASMRDLPTWRRAGLVAASIALLTLCGCGAGRALQQAQRAEACRDWLGAYQAYTAAAQANPADSKIQSRLAYTRGRAANACVAQALAALKKRRPKDALARVAEAHDAGLETASLRQAQAQIEQALARAKTLRDQAKQAAKEGEWIDAVNALRASLEIEQDAATEELLANYERQGVAAYVSKARQRIDEKRLAEAAEWAQKAAAIRQTDEVKGLLAQCQKGERAASTLDDARQLYDQKRFADALAKAEQVAAVAPGSTAAGDLLKKCRLALAQQEIAQGRALAEQGDWEEARKVLLRAKKLAALAGDTALASRADPTLGRCLYDRAAKANARRDWVAAYSDFAEAAKLLPPPNDAKNRAETARGWHRKTLEDLAQQAERDAALGKALLAHAAAARLSDRPDRSIAEVDRLRRALARRIKFRTAVIQFDMAGPLAAKRHDFGRRLFERLAQRPIPNVEISRRSWLTLAKAPELDDLDLIIAGKATVDPNGAAAPVKLNPEWAQLWRKAAAASARQAPTPEFYRASINRSSARSLLRLVEVAAPASGPTQASKFIPVPQAKTSGEAVVCDVILAQGSTRLPIGRVTGNTAALDVLGQAVADLVRLRLAAHGLGYYVLFRRAAAAGDEDTAAERCCEFMVSNPQSLAPEAAKEAAAWVGRYLDTLAPKSMTTGPQNNFTPFPETKP